MTLLSKTEMNNVTASGCGWLKRLARRAEKEGRAGDAAEWSSRYAQCKWF